MESVIEFVTGNIWNIGFFIMTAIGVIFAYKSWTATTRKKRFTYRVIGNFMLLNPKTSLDNKIKLLYEDKSVDNVRIMFMRLKNEGNVVISKEDFEIPLQIRFDAEGTKVLSARLHRTEPKDLETLLTLKFTEEVITIEPIMLNPGDSIDLGVTIDGKNEMEPVFTARIEGLKGIEKSNERIVKARMQSLLTIILAATITFTLFLLNNIDLKVRTFSIVVLYIYVFVGMLAMITLSRISIMRIGWKRFITFDIWKNVK